MPRSSSFLAIFRFEVRHHLRQPLFYLITFFLSVLLFLDGSGQGRGGATGRLLLNAPAVVLEHLMKWIHVVLFLMAAFVVSAALRDFDRRTSELFFSKPVSRFDYLIGRFAGAMVACILPYLIGAVALAIGTAMPDIDPQRVGPFRLAPYAFAFGVLILPTLLALGGAFFALAIWTRSTIATYVGIVAFVALSAVSGLSSSQLVSPWIGQLLDPFGVSALGDALKHWTTAELNTAIPSLSGMLLWNRVFWLAFGMSAFGIAIATFDPARERSPARKTTSRAADELSRPRAAQPAHLHSPLRTFSRQTVRIQFLRQTWREASGVLGSLPFLGMLLLGLIVLIESAGSAGNIFGMPVYPRTHLMVEALQAGFAKVLLLAAVLFSGELIWRDRALDVHEVVDALPTPNGVFIGAKLVALLLVIAVFQLTGVLALIGFQLLQGYTHLELGLYTQGVLIAAAYPALMMVLSCAFHVVARNRIAGYGLVVLFIVTWDLLEEFGFEHHLYRYASLPPTPYSDLNGFGHFLGPFAWYALYWGLVAAMLVGVSIAFWRRGTDDSWRARWTEARARFRGLPRAATVISAFGAIVTGAWILYNTNVLNEYVPSTTMAARRALYEKRYQQHQNANLPRVVAVRGEVDIYPRDRRVHIHCTYWLRNQSSQPQRDIHVSIPAGVRVNRLDLPAHGIVHADDTLGYHILQLHAPLAPNDSLEFGFDLVVENKGFVNNGASVTVVENGTYFTKRDFFPVIGFDPQRLLIIPDVRKELGLDPLSRLADPGDLTARNRSPRAPDADRVAFDVTVSTDPDQTAITSGELLRSWTANDRHYFHYRANVPITHHFGFVSARYTVMSSEWNGVAIAIYHHPEHRDNIGRMMHAARQSLDYFTKNFGPYQHRSLRLVEFPRYTRDATSLPGFISFSESMGFNARLSSDVAVDYPFYVTAHEIAHQWWGHQLVGANTQGTGTLHESLAQYSALMVMERELGRNTMPDVLNYEREWYLRGRAGERGAEPSLARVERQDYVYYHKGALAMYALRDMVGEAPLNLTLSRLLTQFAGAPPYATTHDLLNAVRSIVPAESTNDFVESFEEVVMTDAGLTEPVLIRQPSGKYQISLNLTMRKTRTDSSGVEQSMPTDAWVDLAIYDDTAAPPTIERRRITASPATLQFVRDHRPSRIILDPFHKLVERNREDNVYRVPGLASGSRSTRE